jgi:hypothetical protein
MKWRMPHTDRCRRAFRFGYYGLMVLWAVVVFATVRAAMRSMRQPAADAQSAGGGGGESGAADGPKGSSSRPSRNTPKLTDAQWRACVCPQLAACENTDLEQRCVEYLGNYSNVASVLPMISNLRTGRTAKLRLMYKNPCVQAIAKVPQSLFPLEPYAEYVAFETDRVMGFLNVPPTTFTFVPISDIEAAAATFANKARKRKGKDGVEVPDEQDPTHEYAKWISTEVLAYAMKRGLIVPHPESGKMVLGCSVQLYLHSVRSPQRTVLQDEDGYPQMLRSASLARAVMASDAGTAFTARKAMSMAGDAVQLLHSHRTRMKSDLARARYDRERGTAPRVGGDEEDTDADVTTRKEYEEMNTVVTSVSLMDKPRRDAVTDVLRYVSDTAVFDAIIGNDDRGPIKNANVYVVNPKAVPEACHLGGRRHWGQAERAASGGRAVTPPATEPVLRRLWLDQGKSFYKENVLNAKLQVPLRLHAAQCVFRRSTLSVLQALKDGELFRRLQHILPPQIVAAIGEHRLAWASHRSEEVSEHARHCGLAMGGDSRIVVWD